MSMEAVLILLAILAGVTHAAETQCNATHSTPLCSVTLGGSVYIQMITNASGHQLRCNKQLPTVSINVFTLRKEKVMIQEAFRNRTEFFIHNRTLKITDVMRNDSGLYITEVFDPEGLLVEDVKINLDVQETTSPILIIALSAGAASIVLILCCVYWTVRHSKKKPGSGK